MLDILLPLLTTILGISGTLGAIWLKSHLANKASTGKPGKVETCIIEDTKVMDEMDDMLTDLDADRVAIYSFHNGGEFYSGKSMQKMSISYESVGHGISRNQLKKQSIPISACLNTLQPLMHWNEYHVPDVIKDYPEGLCKYYLLEDGTKSTYQWAIIDLEENTIGMLRIDFVKKLTRLTEDQLQSLLYRVIKLPGYLKSTR